MKTRIYNLCAFFVMALAVAVVSIGCSKDDDPSGGPVPTGKQLSVKSNGVAVTKIDFGKNQTKFPITLEAKKGVSYSLQHSGCEWLSADDPSGYVSTAGKDVELIADRRGKDPGVYSGTMIVNADGEKALELPATMNVDHFVPWGYCQSVSFADPRFTIDFRGCYRQGSDVCLELRIKNNGATIRSLVISNNLSYVSDNVGGNYNNNFYIKFSSDKTESKLSVGAPINDHSYVDVRLRFPNVPTSASYFPSLDIYLDCYNNDWTPLTHHLLMRNVSWVKQTELFPDEVGGETGGDEGGQGSGTGGDNTEPNDGKDYGTITSGYFVATGGCYDVKWFTGDFCGRIDPQLRGTYSNIEAGIVYSSTNKTPTEADRKSGGIIYTTDNRFKCSIKDLRAGETNYYRAYVKLNGNYYYAKDVKTANTKGFNLQTGEATDITETSAKLSGSFDVSSIVMSGATYTFGFLISTNSDLSNGTYKSVTTLNGNNFNLSVTGLQASYTYYYASYIKVGSDYYYGSTKSFSRFNGPQYVDLGLPSRLKWATCNVGATKPEEYGNYYSWGETKTKSDYSSSTTPSYEKSNSVLKSMGILGSNGQLTPAYDAATANWGGSWRMPTLDEIEELRDKCTTTWTTRNGVNGCLVTGPNGNSIFLPAVGYRNGTKLYVAGDYGFYWSSTPFSDEDIIHACCLIYDYSSKFDCYGGIRSCGYAVRPVKK